MNTPTIAAGMDWARARALAAARFGLGPREFWALSLADWRALCAPLSSDAGPPRRADLEALCALFPDRPIHRADHPMHLMEQE